MLSTVRLYLRVITVHQNITVLVDTFCFKVSTLRLHFSGQKVHPSGAPACKQVLRRNRGPTQGIPYEQPVDFAHVPMLLPCEISKQVSIFASLVINTFNSRQAH